MIGCVYVIRGHFESPLLSSFISVLLLTTKQHQQILPKPFTPCANIKVKVNCIVDEPKVIVETSDCPNCCLSKRSCLWKDAIQRPTKPMRPNCNNKRKTDQQHPTRQQILFSGFTSGFRHFLPFVGGAFVCSNDECVEDAETQNRYHGIDNEITPLDNGVILSAYAFI
jgi:hypothetical protein